MEPQMILARVTAMSVVCRYCNAQVDRECFDPRTGNLLVKQPAHMMRLQDTGF